MAAPVSAACFPAEIMDVARTGEAQRLLGAAAPQRPGLTKLRATLATPVVARTVGAGAFVCGTVGFVLYFIKQVAAREAPSWPTSLQTTAVSAVFVAAPIPGNLVGAYVVEKRIGGYDRLGPTLSFVSAAALGAVGCVALLPLAGPGRPWPFIALCWGFLFFGALPTPAINGVVLAASPRDAATIASGIQFAAQNLMKAIVPLVGGRVVDRVGLLLGFRSVLLACAAGYAAFALLARRAAADHVRRDPAPDDRAEHGDGPVPVRVLHGLVDAFAQRDLVEDRSRLRVRDRLLLRVYPDVAAVRDVDRTQRRRAAQRRLAVQQCRGCRYQG